MIKTLNQREPVDLLDILEHEMAMVNRAIANFVVQREHLKDCLDRARAEFESGRVGESAKQAA